MIAVCERCCADCSAVLPPAGVTKTRTRCSSLPLQRVVHPRDAVTVVAFLVSKHTVDATRCHDIVVRFTAHVCSADLILATPSKHLHTTVMGMHIVVAPVVDGINQNTDLGPSPLRLPPSSRPVRPQSPPWWWRACQTHLACS